MEGGQSPLWRPKSPTTPRLPKFQPWVPIPRLKIRPEGGNPNPKIVKRDKKKFRALRALIIELNFKLKTLFWEEQWSIGSVALSIKVDQFFFWWSTPLLENFSRGYPPFEIQNFQLPPCYQSLQQGVGVPYAWKTGPWRPMTLTQKLKVPRLAGIAIPIP